MNRKRQQGEILFKLGQLLGPLLKMAESPVQYDGDERTRILARFHAEANDFCIQASTFLKGEPGHFYSVHQEAIFSLITSVQRAPQLYPVLNLELAAGYLRNVASAVQDQLLSVPIPIDSTIYEARTPFTTYCFVKDLCSTVKTQIVWLDRYFDQTIFHRFFTETPKSALITLVTISAAKLTNPKDKQRSSEFMDISRMFAAERGITGYRLVENANFHDRWLRCDDKLFTLGGSIKDLAKPFTISKLDSTPDNRKHFDDAITNGIEVFGSNQPVHP